MDTEKEGAVQSDSIEQADGVQEVAEEVQETTEAPQEDKVQDWEPLNRLISEREAAARAEAERHFQSVKDKEVAAEKRARLEAERQAKLERANLEGLREVFLAGLDPETRAEAEKRSAARVAQVQAELNKPSPEMLAEAQEFNEKVLKARAFAAQLEAEGDIETDFKNMKCSDPTIVMTTPDDYIKTAKARLKELRNPSKPKETEVEKEEKKPKKAPKVDEGGSRGSSLNDDEFVKAYAKGERNSPADHKRMHKIINGG